MVTMSIRMSAKQDYKPLTVNKLLKLAMSEGDRLKKIFWPRYVKDKGINSGRQVGAKVDTEGLNYLRELKKYIRSTFNIFVSYSMLICVLIRIYNKPGNRLIMSLNVKGYKASIRTFSRCLRGIAARIKEQNPDIVFLQEFRPGDDNMFLNVLMKELGRSYRLILPAGYNEKEEFNYCMCVMLVGKHHARPKIMKMGNGAEDHKLRYNYVRIEDYTYLNVWAPQVSGGREDRMEAAQNMWVEIIKRAEHYSMKKEKFLLAGDLNAFMGGSLADKIMTLNYLLSDTKVIEAISVPTGPVNILDYAFVNRYAGSTDLVRTGILSPSIRQQGLSDHEALLTSITGLEKDVSVGLNT